MWTWRSLSAAPTTASWPRTCRRANGRLRWQVVPPLRSVDASIEEANFGKENGAVGLFFRGIERDRTLDDPYFFPVYEEAAKLDMPVCVHTGAGCLLPFTAHV